MSKKAAKKVESTGDEFEGSGYVPQPFVFTPDQLALYFVIALATAIVPAYMYFGLFAIDIDRFGPIYVAVSLVTAGLLTVGYKNAEANSFTSLSLSRQAVSLPLKKYSLSKNELESHQRSITGLEAQLWAVFLNNAIYVAFFLFCTFYVLGTVDAEYSYPISSIFGAAVAWQLSNGLTHV